MTLRERRNAKAYTPQPTRKSERNRSLHKADDFVYDEDAYLSNVLDQCHYALFADMLPLNEPEPQSIAEAKKLRDWKDWFLSVQEELKSLIKRDVISAPVELPPESKIVGHRWVFTRKKNPEGKVLRYKGRIVAQGYTQTYGLDYQDTYAPVLDQITYRLLIALSTYLQFDMDSMDVVTAFLYGYLDEDIYMKVPEYIVIPPHLKNPAVKLKRSLYGLKQAGRQWYIRYAKALLDTGYKTTSINPCIFYKYIPATPTSPPGRVIASVYVDDTNVFGDKISKNQAKVELSKLFEMKDSGKLTNCIGIQVEYIKQGGVIVHQTAYAKRILEKYKMDKCNRTRTNPLEVRTKKYRKHFKKYSTLHPEWVENDYYRPTSKNEKTLPSTVPFRQALGSLAYLANCTRPDICFHVNLIARNAHNPCHRHWKAIQMILRYLKRTFDYGLYYNGTDWTIKAYADAGYLSDPYTGRSQTGYIITIGETAFCWRSIKQSTVATSTSLAEMIALYECSRELTWIQQFLSELSTGLHINIKSKPITIYEDNQACIKQLETGYIKTDRTKHVLPVFFYPYNLIQEGKIKVENISSEENIADIMTKTLHGPRHQKLAHKLGLRSISSFIK